MDRTVEPMVVLVNEQDDVIGKMPKLEAHKKGVLHRAISVFIINNKNEWMLQRRALHKYHSPGLWTNTCCSHPEPGEKPIDAAKRRLVEEMGISCALEKSFDFIYKAHLENDLIEYELDHVFIGRFEEMPLLNPEEVMDWKWVTFGFLEKDVQNNPANYTEWFKLIYQRVQDNLLTPIKK